MRRSLLSAAVITLALTSGAFAAAAAPMSDTGKIKALDPAKHEVTLDDGKIFVVPATWKFASHKPGDAVKVTYKMMHGQMHATHVMAAS